MDFVINRSTPVAGGRIQSGTAITWNQYTVAMRNRDTVVRGDQNTIPMGSQWSTDTETHITCRGITYEVGIVCVRVCLCAGVCDFFLTGLYCADCKCKIQCNTENLNFYCAKILRNPELSHMSKQRA